MASMNPIPILRIVQGVFAVITLGVTSYVISWHNRNGYASPGESNFLIWCCVWSFLALLYLGLAPTYLPNLYHKWAVLGVEALTVIFWFCGWIAQAAYLGAVSLCSGTVCGCARASVPFALFSWIAWCISLYFVIRAILAWNNRQEDPEEKPRRQPSSAPSGHHRSSSGKTRRHKSHRSHKNHRSQRNRSESSSEGSSESPRIATASPSVSSGEPNIVAASPDQNEEQRYARYVHPEPPSPAGGIAMPSAQGFGGRMI